MSKVVDGVIFLRKGDTESLSVSAKNGTEDYTFQVGDVVTMTVRETPEESSEVLLQKAVTVATAGTSVTIALTAEQTGAVEAGKYSCDIQLDSDGTIKTLFPVMDTDDPKYTNANWKNIVFEGEVTVADDGD